MKAQIFPAVLQPRQIHLEHLQLGPGEAIAKQDQMFGMKIRVRFQPVHQGGERLILVDGQAERSINLSGKVSFPFFGQLILDCLNRTENAMSQRHAFLAAELSLRAAKQAVRIQ